LKNKKTLAFSKENSRVLNQGASTIVIFYVENTLSGKISAK
jgi:hypothetical protein